MAAEPAAGLRLRPQQPLHIGRVEHHGAKRGIGMGQGAAIGAGGDIARQHGVAARRHRLPEHALAIGDIGDQRPVRHMQRQDPREQRRLPPACAESTASAVALPPWTRLARAGPAGRSRPRSCHGLVVHAGHHAGRAAGGRGSRPPASRGQGRRASRPRSSSPSPAAACSRRGGFHGRRIGPGARSGTGCRAG